MGLLLPCSVHVCMCVHVCACVCYSCVLFVCYSCVCYTCGKRILNIVFNVSGTNLMVYSFALTTRL